MERQYVSVSQAALPPAPSQVNSPTHSAPPQLSHRLDVLQYVLQMPCAFIQEHALIFLFAKYASRSGKWYYKTSWTTLSVLKSNKLFQETFYSPQGEDGYICWQ